MMHRLHWLVLLGCALTSSVTAAQALQASQLDLRLPAELPAPTHVHTGEPLPSSDTLTLLGALDAAQSSHPDSLLQAGRDLADAELTRGATRLLAAPATLSLRYENDTVGSNVGLQEWGSTIDFSLFMPAERQARKISAEQQQLLTAALAAASRLQIAGELRNTLWDIRAAAVEVDMAQLALAAARRMQQTVQKSVAAGASAAAELPLLAAISQQREADLHNAQVELAHSQRRYLVLTGLDVLPTTFAEPLLPLTTEQDVLQQHPLLQLVAQQREVAAAGLQLADRSWQQKPSIGVGMRGERGRSDQQYVEVAGLFVSIPLDFGGYNSTQKSQARISLAQAERDQQQALRQLQLNLHDAELNQLSAQRSSELARHRAELAQRAHALATRAYELGEIGLTALLRAADEQRQAALELALQEVRLQRSIAMLNQAAGHLPQ